MEGLTTGSIKGKLGIRAGNTGVVPGWRVATVYCVNVDAVIAALLSRGTSWTWNAVRGGSIGGSLSGNYREVVTRASGNRDHQQGSCWPLR